MVRATGSNQGRLSCIIDAFNHAIVGCEGREQDNQVYMITCEGPMKAGVSFWCEGSCEERRRGHGKNTRQVSALDVLSRPLAVEKLNGKGYCLFSILYLIASKLSIFNRVS